MASPTAMAKCLRADARLLDAEGGEYEAAERMARGLHQTTVEMMADQTYTKTFVTMILMLAAAAALEVEGE